MSSVQSSSQGDVISVDGKVLRGSYDENNKHTAINMVSAWSSLNSATLGQIKTASKSNEITAIPKLLEMLNIKSCIITIDAAGCQKTITKTIVEKEADYVLVLKGNQPTLYNSAQKVFEEFLEEQPKKINFTAHLRMGMDELKLEIIMCLMI